MRFRPWKDYRPAPVVEAEHDPHPDSPVEWADTGPSNLFAWGSKTFVPAWCQTPEHFTSRLTQYLWTDCPCCLLWRGIPIGFIAGYGAGTIITIALVLAFRH